MITFTIYSYSLSSLLKTQKREANTTFIYSHSHFYYTFQFLFYMDSLFKCGSTVLRCERRKEMPIIIMVNKSIKIPARIHKPLKCNTDTKILLMTDAIKNPICNTKEVSDKKLALSLLGIN